MINKIRPNKYNADYQRLLGMLYFKRGDFSKAIDHYNMALQLRKYAAAYYGERARIYLRMKAYRKALDDLNSGYRLNRSEKSVLLGLSMTYLQIGKYDSCIVFSRALIEVDSCNPDPYYLLAKSYAKRGQKRIALIYIDKFIELAGQSPLYSGMISELRDIMK